MTDDPQPPSKAEVALQLESLIRGERSREEVSDWATPWINHDFRDAGLREAIDALCGADSPTTDRPYLYGKEDFVDWLAELNN